MYKLQVTAFIRKLRNHPVGMDRKFLSYHYILGRGIEIGALHSPLPVNKKRAVVRYVDRMNENDLRSHYPELKDLKLVPIDYIADGELLESIKNSTQDFVIANHFIEHCQNPILTIKNMLRVLRPGGIIFFAVPDRRFTFDKGRGVTPVSHVVNDFEQGPQNSKKNHFEEWVRNFNPEKDDEDIEQETKKLMDQDYSIHFHVWEKSDMDELLIFLIKKMRFNFEIEFSLRRTGSNENIYILRKN